MGLVHESGYTLEMALNSVGRGWALLVKEAFLNKMPNVMIVQVKEKFGGLRIYSDRCSDKYHQLLHDIEMRSLQTCEVCGNPGEPRMGGWIKTLCEPHHIENEKDKRKHIQ